MYSFVSSFERLITENKIFKWLKTYWVWLIPRETADISSLCCFTHVGPKTIKVWTNVVGNCQLLWSRPDFLVNICEITAHILWSDKRFLLHYYTALPTSMCKNMPWHVITILYNVRQICHFSNVQQADVSVNQIPWPTLSSW